MGVTDKQRAYKDARLLYKELMLAGHRVELNPNAKKPPRVEWILSGELNMLTKYAVCPHKTRWCVKVSPGAGRVKAVYKGTFKECLDAFKDLLGVRDGTDG